MILYFDTSALIKAFHKEKGSEKVVELLEKNQQIWVSELTKIEFKSALYCRFNNKQISKENLSIAFKHFENFLNTINITPLSSLLISEAEQLFSKFHSYGLRTLDALQLAGFVLLYNKESYFVSADGKLCSIANKMDLNIINPLTSKS
ncbi:MAG: type II toxin-antitoxin system VapC family toxin [Bacteroidales bacterium]|nr:type II toxin-antitoxin system VapC family toxin [Bacteroidales bacterium]